MTYRLAGHGFLPWDAVLELLDGMTCAWADFRGFHVGSPPPQRPASTHLWGWSEGRWARLRVDGGGGSVVALLSSRPDASGDQVEIAERTTTTWAGGDQRVGALPEALTEQPVRLLSTVEPMPLTFVEMLSGRADRSTPDDPVGT